MFDVWSRAREDFLRRGEIYCILGLQMVVLFGIMCVLKERQMIKLNSAISHTSSLIFCFSVLYNIMANEYVSDGYKDRLRVAARSGRDDGVCYVSLKSSKITSTFYNFVGF